MSIIRRLFFASLAPIVAGGVDPGLGRPARAATPAHDLYLCTNLSAQSAAVMGRGGPARSGLYRSSDRTTFTHLGPHHIRLFQVATDPREPGTLFVAALDGMLRTRDGGRSWRILTSWDMTEPKAFAFDPQAPDHVYAGLPDGIAVSRDRGQTWQRMHAGIRRAYTNALAVDRTQAGRVLAGTELGLYLTEDGARTWRLVQPTAKVTYDLRQSPHDPRHFLAATSADGVLWSEDRGATWRRLPGVGTDHTLHNAVFDPTDARRLALCGWGAGVQVSEDGGRTFVDRTAGLPRREVWSVAADPDFPNRLYAAPYLEDLFVSDDFGRTWRPVGFAKATLYAIAFLPRP
ncbi:MAG: hypothetical protein HZC55_19005 [Verrucomicrobia bacterium]|nr:hypothetical protein [Verrucomicrobiota bacterium]